MPKPQTEGHEFTAGELEAMLPGLLVIRPLRDSQDAAYKTGAAAIRSWLDAHPGGELFEGESRTRAWVESRAGSLDLDADGRAEKRPELLLGLAMKGAVKLDGKAWLALQGKAAEVLDINPFIGRAGGGGRPQGERRRGRGDRERRARA